MSSMTRRNFLLGTATVMGAMLAGCSGETAAEDAATDSTTDDTTTAADEAEAGSAEGGSVLVAYYSAQGHTAAVADAIASELGADTFVVTPTEPYTDDDLNWNDPDSRVSVQHEDESQRDVELEQVTPDGWEDYDTVLLGYPIWWGIAAWPVDGFVSGNDFEDKTVIPFCTSASSGLGESGELLAELAGSGDWQEGQRFSSSADADEVAEWARSLEL